MLQEIPEVDLAVLMDRYATLLLDAYGVLVSATGALPGAAACVDALNQAGKPYYVLTNDASKLPEHAAARYRGFGLPVDASRIISAGSLLAPYFAARGLSGRSCAVLGPADSARYVELAGGRVVAVDESFDILVIGDETGFPFPEAVDAVLSHLIHRLDRGAAVELVLPNPDLMFPRAADAFGIAAGGIALMLEAALRTRYPDRPALRFTRLGKPHRAIFEEAARRSGTRDMVMIGDQLDTDIRGARGFGIDCALFTGGVTRAGLSLGESDPRPTYRMARL